MLESTPAFVWLFSDKRFALN